MIPGFDAEFSPLLQHQKVPSSEEGIDDDDVFKEESLPFKIDVKKGNSFLRSNPSLELLTPPFGSDLRKSSLLTATFGMVATIIGGGILSIPLSFQKLGLVLGSVLFIISAFATAFSLNILCYCSRRTGSISYTEVVRVAFGPSMEFATTCLLFTLLLFMITAYMVLLKNIWSPIIGSIIQSSVAITAPEEKQRLQEDYVLIMLLLLITPLVLRRDLHALRYNCYVGFFSITVLCFAVAYRAYERNVEDPSLFFHHAKLFPSSWSDGLFAFPLVILNFLCSYNVLSVHGALVNPTSQRVQSVINLSLVSVFILSYVFGVVGYLYAYDDTRGNILLNFDLTDRVILLGRIGYGVTLLAAIPMVALPCRDALLSLAPHFSWKHLSRTEGILNHLHTHERTSLLQQSSSDNFERTSNDEKNDQKDYSLKCSSNNIFFYFATFFILSIAFFGAAFAPGVASVWSICGSGLAFIVAFILPASCYIKIRHKQKGREDKLVILSWLLLAFATVSAIACTLQTLWGFFL